MIIDSHTHYPFGGYSQKHSIEEVLKLAEGFGIVRMVLLGDVFRYGATPDAAQLEEINDDTLRLVDEYPDRLLGCCYLNPLNSRDSIHKEAARCFATPRMVAIKLEVSVRCNSGDLDKVMEAAGQHGRPVYQHAWYKTDGNMEGESSPADVADLAGRFPEVRIIMPHLAGIGVRGLIDVEPHPNVSVDTSGGLPVSGLVEEAVRRLGLQRVLYGSDFPVRDFSAQIGRVLGAEITAEEKAAILYGNAANLFGIN